MSQKLADYADQANQIKADYEQQLSDKQTFIDKLCDTLEVNDRKDNDPDRTKEVTFKIDGKDFDNGYGDFRVDANGYRELKIRSISDETALKIATFLRTLRDK